MSVPVEKAASFDTIPGLAHGFFGRQGGVSSGIYASLNMSTAGKDDPIHVGRNRALALETLGLSATSLASVTQVHSNRVKVLTKTTEVGVTPEADAMVTNIAGLSLGILTADCVPVLFLDPKARIIGAAHAGWKGAIGGIIANTIAAMTELGAHPGHIRAVIGPAIAGQNYEVGPEFAKDLIERHPAANTRIFVPEGARAHFDLPGFVHDQLVAGSVGKIETVGGDTYANPDRYFSHRHATHAGTTTGRQMALIGFA